MNPAADGPGDRRRASQPRPDTFGFYPMDRYIQTRLFEACRSLLQRIPPAQVRKLACLMYALQRLPLTTPGVIGGVVLTTRMGDCAAHHGFELTPEEFSLSTGESIDAGCGMDHSTRNVLEVGTSAMRDIDYGADFTEWLNLFCEQAQAESSAVEIYCDADAELDLYADPEGIPWEDNPLLDDASDT